MKKIRKVVYKGQSVNITWFKETIYLARNVSNEQKLHERCMPIRSRSFGSVSTL